MLEFHSSSDLLIWSEFWFINFHPFPLKFEQHQHHQLKGHLFHNDDKSHLRRKKKKKSYFPLNKKLYNYIKMYWRLIKIKQISASFSLSIMFLFQVKSSLWFKVFFRNEILISSFLLKLWMTDDLSKTIHLKQNLFRNVTGKNYFIVFFKLEIKLKFWWMRIA